MVSITHAGLTDVGRVRQENQDRWFADAEEGLYLIADGIGGSRDGGLAAQIVVEVLPPLLRARLQPFRDLADPTCQQELVATVAELSDRLQSESREQFGAGGLGSTVVLAVVRGTRALVAHLGDSRAYLLRGGRLQQLTHDHTLVQILIDSGEVTVQEAARHPARGQLTRYVGMPSEPLPESQLVELAADDRLLLCSDGLSGMLDGEVLTGILQRQSEPAEACRRLVEAANDAGGQDNITAVVMAV